MFVKKIAGSKRYFIVRLLYQFILSKKQPVSMPLFLYYHLVINILYYLCNLIGEKWSYHYIILHFLVTNETEHLLHNVRPLIFLILWVVCSYLVPTLLLIYLSSAHIILSYILWLFFHLMFASIYSLLS